MRLYIRADGSYAGTQKDAGKGAVQVEVPTDKEGLIAYLNSQLGEAAQVEPVAGAPSAGPAPIVCPNCKRDHADARRIAQLTEQAAIRVELEHHIFKGDLHLVGGLIDATLNRFKELREGALA